MTSLILTTTSRLMLPLLLFFSVFLLVRGHHNPGGGFAGGLVAASGYALCLLAQGVEEAKRMLRVQPLTLVGTGLAVIWVSAVLPLLAGKPALTGAWLRPMLPFGELELGTPLLFDVGIYFTVIGVTLTLIFTLAEE